MPVVIEAKVYDMRDGTVVGVIVTDGVTVKAFDAGGAPDDRVLICIASFFHHYNCSTYRRAVAGVPYPRALHEALLQIDVSSHPWRIVTNIT